MPSLSRVLRHVEALIAADPANAEHIRAALPAAPHKRTAHKVSPAKDAPPSPPVRQG